MSVDTERQAFLAHIKVNPEDDVLRCAYSDFLDEHDLPEEADKQRNWREAKQWLVELAARMGTNCTNYDEYADAWSAYHLRGDPDDNTPEPTIEMIKVPVSYEDVIQAGHWYLENGDYFIQQGHDQARSVMFDLDTRLKFWGCWSIMTGRALEELDEDNKDLAAKFDQGYPNPFSCSC